MLSKAVSNVSGHRRQVSVSGTLFQELISFVSFLKMKRTCYSVLMSPWRIWRAQSSRFTTPACRGSAVRIAFPGPLPWSHRSPSCCLVEVASTPTRLHVPVFHFSESDVALCTREGHVLSFSLSSNLTTTLLDNSSLVSYSGWRRATDLSIDWLITADGWTTQ